MKKVIVIVMILCMSLSGCSIQHFTIEQSASNFEVFKKSLNEIVIKYGFELLEKFDENIENQESYKDLFIVISDKSDISLRMVNSGDISKKGVQRFDLQYSIEKNNTPKETFNLELFVELVNAISGKMISQEFCQEFLDAPEEEFSPSRYSIIKSSNQKVLKQEFLNFGEDWAIGYELDINMTEVLSFSGLTK